MLNTAVALLYYDIHCEVYCMYEYQSESYMPAIVCNSIVCVCSNCRALIKDNLAWIVSNKKNDSII